MESVEVGKLLDKAKELFYEKDKTFYSIIHVAAIWACDASIEDEPHTHSVLKKVRAVESAVELGPYLSFEEVEYLLTLLTEEIRYADESENKELLEAHVMAYAFLHNSLVLSKLLKEVSPM